VSDYFLLFMGLLLFVAAVLGEDFVLTLIYLFAGVFILGHWWSQKALQSISIQRTFTRRIFFGEKVNVKLDISNKGWLPVVWLQIHESLHVDLTVPNYYQYAFSLGPKESRQIEYTLTGSKRGYYRIGPLAVHSGDILGMVRGGVQRQAQEEYLTVYPKIVPLTKVAIPSYSPLGTLRHTYPIFEDPTRVLSKRDYVSGDSLRRIDWKASASSRRLQVKLFEPSIALETAIFLNLNSKEYDIRSVFDSTELAIIIAASLANWITEQRQAVGLFTNGVDPGQSEAPLAIQPRQGRGHLMRILDILARVGAAETIPFIQLVQHSSVSLAWGTTLILITNEIDNPFFEGLFQVRRKGLNVVLILSGRIRGYQSIQERARRFGFQIYRVSKERDLELWKQ
jgi:uncharacterized protein (DUF58 family)